MTGTGHAREEPARDERVAGRDGPRDLDAGPLPVGGGPIGARDALRLQRAGGNAAVAGLIQRQSHPPTHAAPTNLRMGSTGAPVPSDPSGLMVTMRWDSSTGNLADLAGAGVLRERVTRVGAVPMPPFVAGLSIVQPLVENELPASMLTQGVAPDSHFGFGLQLQPTVRGSYTSLQEYQWGPTSQGPWQTIATFEITRSVYPDHSGAWRYRVAKVAASGGAPVLNDTQLTAAPAPHHH